MRDWGQLRKIRLRMVLGAVVVFVLAGALIACGDDDDDDATDEAATATLPTEFTGEFLQIRGGTPEQPEALAARLQSDDGVRATITLDVVGQPLTSEGAGECGGETYDEIMAIDGITPGTLELRGLGTAEIEVTETAVAFDGPPPPVCDQREGTWTGTEGELAGRGGSFSLVGTHAQPPGESTLALTED